MKAFALKAFGATKKHLWPLLAGALIMYFAARAGSQERKAKKHQDIAWRHKAGSILEDEVVAHKARDRMIKHDARAKKARESVRRRIDEMANANPTAADLLNEWNSDRLFRKPDYPATDD